MTAVAATEGLDFRFDLARPGNSFDAHRLLHHAATQDKQLELMERLLHATFTDGEPIGERETLARLANEIGLDDAREVLGSDRYGDDVRADEQQAAAYGITAVPFFVIDGRYGVSGAQPAELLVQLLDRAYGETAVA
jgi:predicted DsbA family dithiol-disulfide isomerase